METTHPVVKCDGDDGMCEEFELDVTLGGLGTIVGSETQLPRGWTGDRPGKAGGGEQFCPHHSGHG